MKRISETYVIIDHLSRKEKCNPVKEIIMERKYQDLTIAVVKLNPCRWGRFIEKAVEYQREWHNGKRQSGYSYHVGTFGEHIVAEYLKMKGYKILLKHEFSWEHGSDMYLIDKTGRRRVVEVKTTLSHRIFRQKMYEAKWQVNKYMRKIQSDGTMSITVYISKVRNICVIRIE